MTRRLVALVLTAAVAAAVVPAVFGGPDLDQIALALALAGPACGAALAAATGRPLLAASAMAGVGSYISAISSVRGVPVLLAILCGCAGGAITGGLIAALSARLDTIGFLITTIVVTLALGDGVQALHTVTGGQSGLGPLNPISVSLGGRRTLNLTPQGDFHLLLVIAVVIIGASVLLIRSLRGAAWRAIGSDRARAAQSGLHPLFGEVAVLVIAGAMAGLCGALGAHINQVASPSQFDVYAGTLPLLAALTARREPMATGLVAVTTGVVGGLVLPKLGWNGPPTAQSLALGFLAVATLLVLLPGWTARSAPETTNPVAAADDWPMSGLDLQGSVLDVAPITRRSNRGAVLVDAPAFRVEPGQIHAVVGPNGSGKSTLLRAVESGAEVTTSGRVARLAQDGGGFANCTVGETLRLAAGRGRSSEDAAELSTAWLHRIGLDGSTDRYCDELSNGPRRLLDLARILLGAPQVLLCDEPLAGLDDDHREAAISCLIAAAAAGLTIVVTEHDRSAVDRLATSVTELQREYQLS